jgi:AcrR family transcriptional regulator
MTTNSGAAQVTVDPPVTPTDPATLPAYQRARRDRIVQAAIESLADGDYEAVQISDVAERAGVARGTLYRYFSSKEHLYAAALVAWSADYGPRPRAATDEDQSDEDRLRALMRRAMRAFERSPQMLRAQMIIERSTDPNARDLYDSFAAQNTAALSSALRDVDTATSRAIITTVNCVFSAQLRAWAHDRCTMRDVDRAVQATIGLIFGPRPG